MTDTLHASLTPNSVLAGETLEVLFDSSGTFENADKATVEIVEVDAPTEFEAAGSPATIFKAEGTLKANTFELDGTPVIPAAAAGAPTVKVKLGGQTFDVPLLDSAKEHGAFELQLKVSTRAPSGNFQSPATVFVRAFDHFKDAAGRPRPVITFVTGAPDAGFFTHAEKFWKKHADVVVARDGLSLVEILEALNRAGDSFGDWGQINIVAHGHLHDILLSIGHGQERFIHADKVKEDVDALPSAVPTVAMIAADTQIVIRACNAGNDQPLIDALHEHVFRGQGKLFIPKFVQAYGPDDTGQPQELFFESLFFAVRGPSSPTGAALQSGLRSAYDALNSPGKGGVPEDEIALFTVNKDGDKEFLHTERNIGLEKLTKPDGSVMSDAELVASFRTDWVNKHSYHTQSKTWRTDDSTWRIEVKRTKLTLPAPEWFFKVTKGVGTPPFEQLVKSGVSFGTDSDPQIWRIQASGVQPFHATVLMGPADDEVEVEDADSGSPTIVGSTTLTGGNKQTFKLPVTLRMGDAEVVVRQGEAFDVVFACSRRHVDRRRKLRTFDASKTHDQRDLVVPTVGNPEHYGSS